MQRQRFESLGDPVQLIPGGKASLAERFLRVDDENPGNVSGPKADELATSATTAMRDAIRHNPLSSHNTGCPFLSEPHRRAHP
jgi:hypothetical protein